MDEMRGHVAGRQPFRGDVVEFARRTRKNLHFISTARRGGAGAEVHEVVQITLSMLGLVIFPFERYKDMGDVRALEQVGRDREALEQAGWKWTGGRADVASTWDLLKHIRHACAHQNVSFSSDHPDPAEVWIGFRNRDEFAAEICASDLRTFCDELLLAIEGAVG